MTKIQLLFCASLFLGGIPAFAAPPPSAPSSPSGLAVSAREVERLVGREPGSQPGDYRARLVTLRLFGTQGEGATASATFADTASWATTTHAVGQLIGRSLTLAAVHADAAELLDSTTGARLSIRVGAELRVRLIEHAFDFAAIDHGQHQWSVRAAAMARILERYGVGGSAQPTMLHGTPGYRLGAVQPRGVLARLGFLDGDVLVAVNGEPATAESPTAIATAVTRASSQVLLVTLVRGGSRFELAYALD